MVGFMFRGLGQWVVSVCLCVAGMGMPLVLAQSHPDPVTAVHERLDEQLALGWGRVDPPARPPPSDSPAQTADSERFVPQSRASYRQAQDERSRRSAERVQEEQLARHQAWVDELEAQCGKGSLGDAVVGMPMRQFERCGAEIRLGGGVTHRIALRVDGHEGLLYVFAAGPSHKVYAVDGVVTRVEPHPLQVQRVTLPTVGKYPPFVLDPQVTALSGGRFFAFGTTRGEDWTQAPGEDLRQWGQKTGRIETSAPPPPLMWDPQKQGWLRLPFPPACSGLWHQHTLTALDDDRVLVAGGLCDIPRFINEMGEFEPQSHTALWDTRQRRWLEAPDLGQPRIHHTASLLDGQRVMLVGGLDDPLTTATESGEQQTPARALSSVELFNGERFVALPSLLRARAKHASTVLPSGSLLVTGGVGQDLRAMGHVEMWDAAQQRWEMRASMRTARYGHSALLLADGRVLVSGGIDDRERALNATELYDPITDTWTDGPPLPNHLQGHSALLLQDGRVLLAGGLVDPPPLGPWLHSWHQSERAWRAEGVKEHSSPARYSHRPTLVQIAADQVLIFGGHEVYLHRIGSSDPQAPGASSPLPANFPDDWWKPAPRKPSRPGAVTVPQEPPGLLARVLDDLWNARVKLILGAAGMGLLWWLWSARARRGQAGGGDLVARGRWRSWLARVLVYGALLWLALPHLVAYLGIQSADVGASCEFNASACLDRDTQLLKRQWAVPGRSKFSSPRIPCAFVGEWVTQVGSREFIIRLNADGTYRAVSKSMALAEDAGYWAVQGSYMIWRSSKRPGSEMDINRVVANDGQHVELIEGDGRHSHFERHAELPAQQCEP